MQFAHPRTLLNVNDIYNIQFYSSTLWNLFSTTKSQLCHNGIVTGSQEDDKYFIEPVSGTQHIISSPYKGFINFTKYISSNKKSTMKEILECIKNDCQSTTGRNLWTFMLQFGKDRIDDRDIHVPDGHHIRMYSK